MCCCLFVYWLESLFVQSDVDEWAGPVEVHAHVTGSLLQGLMTVAPSCGQTFPVLIRHTVAVFPVFLESDAGGRSGLWALHPV